MCIHRRLASSLVFAMLLGLIVTGAHAGDLPAGRGDLSAGAAPLVGSWQGVTSLGTTVLFTFHPDETFTSSFHFPGAGAGNGHGAWIDTGLQSYVISDFGMILDADNELSLFLTVEGSGTVDGDKADFQVQASLFLPDGTLIDSFPGEVHAKRIGVGPVPQAGP